MDVGRILAVAVVVAAATAHAEDKAGAAAAFERGRALMKAGDHAAACAQFETSMKLDPQLGTQYNRARCYEAIGRLATAWAEYDELAATDDNPRRRADSATRRDALRGRLTRMRVVVAEPVAGLVVRRGDDDVTGLVGTAAPVDPGHHVFTARAPGRREWAADVFLSGEGRTIDVQVPALAPIDAVAPPPPPNAGRVPASPPSARASSHRGRRLASYALVGAGALGLGVGAYFGLEARGLYDEARSACGGDVTPCVGDLTAARDRVAQARDQATYANLAFGVGAVAVAAGVILLVTTPSDGPPQGLSVAPAIDRGSVGVVVGGAL